MHASLCISSPTYARIDSTGDMGTLVHNRDWMTSTRPWNGPKLRASGAHTCASSDRCELENSPEMLFT